MWNVPKACNHVEQSALLLAIFWCPPTKRCKWSMWLTRGWTKKLKQPKNEFKMFFKVLQKSYFFVGLMETIDIFHYAQGH